MKKNRESSITFFCSEEELNSDKEINFTTTSPHLDEILEVFTDFLRAVGFGKNSIEAHFRDADYE